MYLLQCSEAVVEPAPGAAARLGRLMMGGLLFCWVVEISRGGGSTQQPQRTEPCQCVVGQSWACHGALQGQMQPLQCSKVVVEPSLESTAGLRRWFVGVATCCRFVEISKAGGSTRQPQRTEPCQRVSDQPWACHGVLHGQMQPLECASGVVGPALGAAAGLGMWFVGVVVLLLVCGYFKGRKQYSATTAHSALLVSVSVPSPGHAMGHCMVI